MSERRSDHDRQAQEPAPPGPGAQALPDRRPDGAAAVARPPLVVAAAATEHAAVRPRALRSLAVPALVVLAAEPLYVLVDTAVVGHLDRTSLGALALGGVVMSVAAFLGNVLAYGTTGRAARQFGAGDRARAVAEGVQASWLAL